MQSQNFKRKGRKGFTQRTQRIDFEKFFLCELRAFFANFALKTVFGADSIKDHDKTPINL